MCPSSLHLFSLSHQVHVVGSPYWRLSMAVWHPCLKWTDKAQICLDTYRLFRLLFARVQVCTHRGTIYCVRSLFCFVLFFPVPHFHNPTTRHAAHTFSQICAHAVMHAEQACSHLHSNLCHLNAGLILDYKLQACCRCEATRRGQHSQGKAVPYNCTV